LLGVEGGAARLRRDDVAGGDPAEVLLPIDEMAEAKIVLSKDVISESLRRGKREEREAREDKTSPDYQPSPARSRRSAQHKGE
jgi:ribosome maturation factor RimP